MTVSHLKFSDSLASLLKGSVEEKGKAVIALCKRKTAAKPPATIPRPESIQFEALLQVKWNFQRILLKFEFLKTFKLKFLKILI